MVAYAKPSEARARPGRRLIGPGLAAAIFCLLAVPALAFRLTPIVMDFDPSGRGAVRNFELFNEAAEDVPVELSLVVREMNLDGEETLRTVSDDFVVFPAQAILKPGQTQVVQVRWIGDATPARELAFRIVAEQLPVDLDRVREPGALIRMLVRYEGSIYVVPKDAKPAIALESAKRAVDPSGVPKLELVMTNDGSSHGIIKEPSLTLTGAAGSSVTLAGDALASMHNTNVLAKAKRRYVLPWPAGLSGDAAQGRFAASITR